MIIEIALGIVLGFLILAALPYILYAGWHVAKFLLPFMALGVVILILPSVFEVVEDTTAFKFASYIFGTAIVAGLILVPTFLFIYSFIAKDVKANNLKHPLFYVTNIVYRLTQLGLIAVCFIFGLVLTGLIMIINPVSETYFFVFALLMIAFVVFFFSQIEKISKFFQKVLAKIFVPLRKKTRTLTSPKIMTMFSLRGFNNIGESRIDS